MLRGDWPDDEPTWADEQEQAERENLGDFCPECGEEPHPGACDPEDVMHNALAIIEQERLT